MQEYKVILVRRILWLQKLKDRPDQFTVLVREIPLCPEHKSYGCNVHHFFTRHYPQSFQSHQILYDGRDLDMLQVIIMRNQLIAVFWNVFIFFLRVNLHAASR